MSLSEKDRVLIERVLAARGNAGHGIFHFPETLADILQAAREEAYKEGWNDREGDLIAGVKRIMPIGVSHGWTLVPVEPTEEMCAAFLEAEGASIMMDPLGAFEDAYRAMIAASPPPR